MFGLAASVYAYPAALWYMLHNRQQPTELRRHGHCHMVAQCRYLIANTFQRIAIPPSIDHQPPRDSIAFRLISYQSYIHNFYSF